MRVGLFDAEAPVEMGGRLVRPSNGPRESCEPGDDERPGLIGGSSCAIEDELMVTLLFIRRERVLRWLVFEWLLLTLASLKSLRLLLLLNDRSRRLILLKD